MVVNGRDYCIHIKNDKDEPNALPSRRYNFSCQNPLLVPVAAIHYSRANTKMSVIC